jgi:hypothetical protein
MCWAPAPFPQHHDDPRQRARVLLCPSRRHSPRCAGAARRPGRAGRRRDPPTCSIDQRDVGLRSGHRCRVCAGRRHGAVSGRQRQSGSCTFALKPAQWLAPAHSLDRYLSHTPFAREVRLFPPNQVFCALAKGDARHAFLPPCPESPRILGAPARPDNTSSSAATTAGGLAGSLVSPALAPNAEQAILTA